MLIVHLLSIFSCSELNMTIALEAPILESRQTNIYNLTSLLKKLLTTGREKQILVATQFKTKERNYLLKKKEIDLNKLTLAHALCCRINSQQKSSLIQ
jgi:hypothetical protein